MIAWCKKEFRHIVPVFLFFLLSFTILNLTESFILKRAGIAPFSFLTIVFTAALVAKVFLVVDHLPFIEMLRARPLFASILWKTFVYGLVTLGVRLVLRRFNKGMHLPWPFFFTIQAWFFFLYLLFFTARELAHVIGPEKLRQIFFKKPEDPSAD